MSEPDAANPSSGRLFMVAIEYAGADVLADVGGSRRPLLEHAFEVYSGLMPAHPRHAPRVAFPEPGRGWPADPWLARCASCTLAVAELIRDLISALITTTRQRVAVRRAEAPGGLLWLYPAVPRQL